MTMVTDFILAIVIFYLSFELYKQSVDRNQHFITGFLFLVIASITGGIFHGFMLIYSKGFMNAIWKITLYSYGFGSLFLTLGVLTTSQNNRLISILKSITFCKIFIFSFLALFLDNFNMVTIDMLLSVVIMLFVILRKENHQLNTQWLLYGIGISLIVGIIWFFELGLHQNFNHNDLAHIILVLVMYSFYRGFSSS